MPPSNYVPKLYEVPATPGLPLVSLASADGGATLVEPPPRNPLPITGMDLLVLLAGTALLVWALAAGLPKFVLVLASIITVIGFVLPLRKLSHRPGRSAGPRVTSGRPPPAAESATTETGSPDLDDAPPLLLDLADPTSLRLANAYRALLRDAALDEEDELTRAAVDAGHQAVCEAAELVQGRPPANLAELDQLDRRSEAMERLRAALRREQRAGGHPSAPSLAGAPTDAPAMTAIERLDALRADLDAAP